MRRRSLRSSREFKRVLDAGRRGRSDGLTVHVTEGNKDTSRLGLAVRCERAVDRNLLKRRLRASWDSILMPAGLDVVVRADRSALEQPYQQLESHLKRALTRAGVRL